MTKTARVRKFKIAFLKPKTPKEFEKQKISLEKTAKASTKKGAEQVDIDKLMEASAEELRKNNPEYFKKLLSYKLTKHWNDPKEFRTWLYCCGNPSDMVAAVETLLGKNPSPKMVVECWKLSKDSPHVTKLCYSLAPKEMEQAALEQYLEGGSRLIMNDRAFQSKVTVEIYKKLGPDKFPSHMNEQLNSEDAVELIDKDPAKFVKVFIDDVKSPAAKVKLLKNPKVRTALQKDPIVWKQLSDAMPMMPFLAKVDKKLEKVSKENLKTETANEVFKELISDDGTFGMTYYTNSLSGAVEVMTSSREQGMKNIEKRKQELELLRKEGDDTNEKIASLPEAPATQCDVLVTLLTQMLECAFGPDSGITTQHKVLPGMVLTIPLAGDPGVPGGLLKRTFGGNVFDDSGKRTGQVMFTGGTDGSDPRAHTVLIVEGAGDKPLKFDAVLGTVGDAVDTAVAEQFGAWDKTGYVSIKEPKTPIWVSKSKDTSNWVIAEPGLKAAPNKNGFVSAYRLTTDPSKYVVKA